MLLGECGGWCGSSLEDGLAMADDEVNAICDCIEYVANRAAG